MFSLILFSTITCSTVTLLHGEGAGGGGATLSAQDAPQKSKTSPQPKQPAAKPLDVDRLLEDLRSGNEDVRIAAAKKLKELQTEDPALSTQAGLKVLRAAAQPIPFDKPDPAEVSDDLVGLLVGQPRPEYVPIVVEQFERFSENARSTALSLVSQVETKEAAEAYLKIFRSFAKNGKIADAATDGLRSKPRYPEIFFPELLTYATEPKLSFDLYQLCLD